MDLLGSGSAFDNSSAALEQALQRRAPNAVSLDRDSLVRYAPKKFVNGWAYTRTIAGTDYQFHVLLDEEFPRSPVRIALASHDKHLVWPHVEDHSLLCLPQFDLPASNIEAAAIASIEAAEQLVYRCATDTKFVEAEFEQEFLSYWNRAVKDDAVPVYSLLTAANQTARPVAMWEGVSYTLVGENEDQLRQWLKHRGYSKEPAFGKAIAGFLSKAPVPPFPQTPSKLFARLELHSPEALTLFDHRQTSEGDATFVLGAKGATGVGLIANTLSITNHNGFRKGGELPGKAKRLFWTARAKLDSLKVIRIDGPWIHGRGQNDDQPLLERSSVAVLGCGSIGSQVAVLLAQAGVGKFVLVDPELLEAANVGRHALGMESLAHSKAEALGEHLRTRFPHVHAVEAFPGKWEDLSPEQWAQVESANIIVSCIGDWGAEGLLNEWHVRADVAAPIVYGWLDEQGTAAHAVATLERPPCLACVLDDNGRLRVPETEWDSGREAHAEPACGTLFQPFGPIDVARAAALIATLVIDVLTGKTQASSHRVYAGPTERIESLGGKWSNAHMTSRPKEFVGAFEYVRTMEPLISCPICAS